MQIFKTKNIKKSNAFTLVELLVVISIIGLLSALITVSVGVARRNARDIKRLNDLNAISKAIERYKIENNDADPIYGKCSSGEAHIIASDANLSICFLSGTNIPFNFRDSNTTYLVMPRPQMNEISVPRYFYYKDDCDTPCIESVLENGNVAWCQAGSCYPSEQTRYCSLCDWGI